MHLLLTSPDWFDTNALSNVIMYGATDSLFRDTIYIAFAKRWNVYNMLDGSVTKSESPVSCNTIIHLSYSSPGQALIVSCVETTLYYNVSEDRYYDNAPLSSVTGNIKLSEDGHFGVHVNSTNQYNQHITSITIYTYIHIYTYIII